MFTMSKRLILLIICVVLTIQLGVFSVSAENTTCVVTDNINELSTTLNNEGLTVFGYFGGKSGYPVTITVKESVSGATACFEQIMTKQDGYYSILFPYNAAMVGKNYILSVGCITTPVLYQKSFVYSPGEAADVLLTQLNEATTAEEMETVLLQKGTDIGISVTDLHTLETAEAVYADLSGRSYDSMEAFQKAFKASLDAQKQIKAELHEIHVAPDGDNTNDGTAARPLATLEAALGYAEYLMVLGSEKNFEILMHGGEYNIASDIVIQKRYINHLTIKNYQDEQPILNGSKAVAGWEPYKENIYRAKIGLGLEVDVLFENRNMLTKARYPNKNSDITQMESEYLSATSSDDSKTQFVYTKGDLPEMANTTDLEVGIFAGGPGGDYMWQMNTIDVSAIDTNSGLIQLAAPAQYEIGTGSHYFVQGALELLDTPGEFYYDTKTGYVYYYPTDGNIAGKTVSYPVVSNIFTIANSDDSKISNVTIDGIDICCTKRNAKVHINGNFAGGNGIVIRKANNIHITNCEIYSMGGNGIYAEKGVESCVFSGNYLHHNGTAGIILVGTEFDLTKNNLIDNNYIHHQGLIVYDRPGIALNGPSSDGNIISHNRIHDLKRCGITIGYAGGNNIVEYNDVSNVCNGTDDSGMIYTMMTTGTTIIRNNYVHDSIAAGGHQGIYLDEGSNNTIVKNNVIARLGGNCSTGVLAKGTDIQIVNNYFVDITNVKGAIISSSSNYMPTENMVIERNVVYNCYQRIYSHSIQSTSDVPRLKASDYNLFYTAAGTYGFRYKGVQYDFDTYKSMGFETHSLIADPKLISNANGDVRFAYDSPVYSLGIEAIELEEIGLRADFDFNDAADPMQTLFISNDSDRINKGTIKLLVGEEMQLEGVIRSQKGFVVAPASYSLTFAPSEQGIVSVNNEGELTGLSLGTVRITATATKGNSQISTQFDVTVLPEFEVDSALKLQSITLKNSEGKAMTAIKSGSVEVDLQCLSNTDTTAKALVAYVDGSGILRASGLSQEATSFTCGKQATISANITIPEDAEGHIYVFVWDGEDTLRPLMEKITVF